MNGRIYDAKLARFLQADPFIQNPTFSQNLNRYSYVNNNPLNATDPSGYFVSLIVGAVLLALEVELIIVAIAVGITAAVTSLAMGGTLGDALVAGISAAALTFVGGGGIDFGSGSFAFLGKAVAMGTIGGITSTLQGGKFGHGFLSASVGSLAGSSGIGGSTFAGRALVGAIVGGTVSKATGGKFANGAKSGAFSSVLSSIGAKIGASNASGNTSVGSPDLSASTQQIENQAAAAATGRVETGLAANMEEIVVRGDTGLARQLRAQGLSNVIPVPSKPSYQFAPTATSVAQANYSSSVTLSVGSAGYGLASGNAFGQADTNIALEYARRGQPLEDAIYLAPRIAGGGVVVGAAIGYAPAGYAAARTQVGRRVIGAILEYAAEEFHPDGRLNGPRQDQVPTSEQTVDNRKNSRPRFRLK